VGNGPRTSYSTWRVKFSILKHFFEYWSRGLVDQLPRPPCIPPPIALRQDFVPYIYTRKEVRLLLQAIPAWENRSRQYTKSGRMDARISLSARTASPHGKFTDRCFSQTAPDGGSLTVRRRDLSAAHARPTSDARGASSHQLDATGRGPESPDPRAFRIHGPGGIGLVRAIPQADTGTFTDSTCQVESAAPKREALVQRP
jgi:hypothetical protein